MKESLHHISLMFMIWFVAVIVHVGPIREIFTEQPIISYAGFFFCALVYRLTLDK